ncbi:MAG: hypothetical protein ACFB2X_20930 [Rivularia sp. (in: cyanobacteria)]
MSKINYPTLDLFIYNRTPESAQQKYENYWNDLDSKHQTEKKESTSNYKIFCQTEEKDEQIDIYYLRKSIQDTYLLYYNCSQDKEYELSQLTHVITKLKNLAVLPQIEKLDPGKLSQNGYLGKTWMISIWTNDSNEFTQDVAANLYHCLINRKHQHQQVGKFLGAEVWEMWCEDTEWGGIDKDSHVMAIVYPDESKFARGAKYYEYWYDLLLYRHKIIWAYQNGRKLKSQLSEQYDKSLIDSTGLSDKGFAQLKKDLQQNTNCLTTYVRNINLLETQQHTIEVNLRNYEKTCEYEFKTATFLEKFSQIVKQKYQTQLEKDYLGLNPGLAILENVTSTIRGMVEIEQAQQERNLNNTVAIFGVGLATSQLTSAVILDQKSPNKDIPFYNTTAFKSSVSWGIAASFFMWIFLYLIRSFQGKR